MENSNEYRNKFDLETYAGYKIRIKKKEEAYLVEHIAEMAKMCGSVNSYVKKLIEEDYKSCKRKKKSQDRA